MKIITRFVICLALLAPVAGVSQEPPAVQAAPVAPKPELTKFDLDFSGGSPKDLVAAIQRATGKPLNAIIPNKVADVQLPPLKMTGVDVEQLFNALRNTVRRPATIDGYSVTMASSFATAGKVSDDSIWFWSDEPQGNSRLVQTGKVCRFYLLTPYLDKGLTVDDITTAIQTGWKMLGDQPVPSISYHKETKLLIAVGEPRYLSYIDDALKALASAQSPAKALPTSSTSEPQK